MVVKNVWQTYNGTLATLRGKGLTLQEIGDITGVTRERIRQILKEQYGEIISDVFSELDICKIIGIGKKHLVNLRQSGFISPQKGQHQYKYTIEDLEKILDYLASRKCPHCGEHIDVKRIKYCERCGRERTRYTYPFLTASKKKDHLKRARKWIKSAKKKKEALHRC